MFFMIKFEQEVTKNASKDESRRNLVYVDLSNCDAANKLVHDPDAKVSFTSFKTTKMSIST